MYVGYTPGYYGTVVAPSTVVVYGTGYVYPPVYVGSYWYPPPPTYGYGAGFGWGAVTGFAFGAATAAVWGGAWGCCGYDDVDIDRTVNINRNDAYNRWNSDQVRSNVESRAQWAQNRANQARQGAQQRATETRQGAQQRRDARQGPSSGRRHGRAPRSARAPRAPMTSTRAATATPTGAARTAGSRTRGRAGIAPSFGQGGVRRPISIVSSGREARAPRARALISAVVAAGVAATAGAAARGPGAAGDERAAGAGAAAAAAAGAERMSIAVTPEAIRHRPAPAGEWGSTLATDAWLVSARADFWIVAAGGASLLLVMGLVLLWHGDRELDTADLLLSELHLGATYDAIVRRRLWRTMPLEVAPRAARASSPPPTRWSLNGWPLLVTTAILYLGAWHRGRQNLGIARYYQRRVGGLGVARASVAARGRVLSPDARGGRLLHEHGRDPRGRGLPRPDAASRASLGARRAGGGQRRGVPRLDARTGPRDGRRGSGGPRSDAGHVHPAERWLVLANAVAFGSAYVVGAWTASFVLVLAVHHEVQYLYFTYAVARRADAGRGRGLADELRRLGRFAVWPAIGLASWAACTLSGSESLLPFLTAGLLSHYWLDGRIWTARARRLAAA